MTKKTLSQRLDNFKEKLAFRYLGKKISDPVEIANVRESLIKLTDVVNAILEPPVHARRKGVNIEDAMNTEINRCGYLSAMIGLKEHLEMLELRIDSLIVPIEETLGEDIARKVRADPYSNKELIRRAVLMYDQESLDRIKRMQFLNELPAKVSSVLNNWYRFQRGMSSYVNKNPYDVSKEITNAQEQSSHS